jgi:hypothetical protein
METPKQDPGAGGLRIVPSHLRTYTRAEASALYEKFAAEVMRKYAKSLQRAGRFERWWLNQKMKWEIEARVEEFQREGI